MKRYYALLLIYLLWLSSAHASIYVITHSANTITSLEKEEVSAFFLGKKRAFSNGEAVTLIDRDAQSDLRAEFFYALNNMSLPRVNAYWSRLIFSGRMIPPSTIENDQDVLRAITTDINAISYIDFIPNHPDIKIIHTLDKERP